MSYARMIGRAILWMVRNTQVLRVDLMPDHDDVLGFSNHWYPQARETAQPISLGGGLSIRVVAPPLFVATKLEAYKGRGEDDPLSGHDIEDIFNLVDGRPELLDEVRAAGSDLRACIADELSKLLDNALFGYAVKSAAGDPNRNEANFIAMIHLIGSPVWRMLEQVKSTRSDEEPFYPSEGGHWRAVCTTLSIRTCIPTTS
ncbi:MAG: hypothetical protein GYB17_15690 [Gammaproteobacteria bacterium]|nr:hypothetical protein [Gammaproteobacteria bacterium]